MIKQLIQDQLKGINEEMELVEQLMSLGNTSDEVKILLGIKDLVYKKKSILVNAHEDGLTADEAITLIRYMSEGDKLLEKYREIQMEAIVRTGVIFGGLI